MFYSETLKRRLPNQRPATFLAAALSQHMRGAARTLVTSGRLRRSTRTIDVVKERYDSQRAQLPIGSFDDFVLGVSPEDFILLDGRIEVGRSQEAVVRRMRVLEDLVRRYAGDGAVVEFGAGSGRNLFYLARQGMQQRLIGLELSPISVDLACRAADAFGFAERVDFHAVDVTKALPDLGQVDVVFSSHAFEMMPRVFDAALGNIAKLKPKVAIFLEPIEELWPFSVRGMISRLRVRQLDRLRGFLPQASRLGRVVEARELGDAVNVLNATTLLVVELER